MGSISSALSSASSGSSSVTGTTYFNGMSTDAQSLNSEIQREVQMASLPIQLLDNDVANLTNQSNELQTLNTDMTAVQTAIAGIASAAAGNMLSASVSDSSVASVAVGTNATPGSYSVEITNLGSYSNAVSVAGVTDPTSQNISGSATYTLTVNSQPYTIALAPSDNNLDALAQAINDAGVGVQATVVNTGTNSAPEYTLALQSDQLGNVTMQLNDGTQDLLETSGDPGQLAQYSVDGQSITSDSDSVTLAPGVTLNLTGTTAADSPVTVNVTPDSTSIGNALQSFVTAYNTAATDLAKNRGQSGGALAGQSIVGELGNSLQSLAGYMTGTSGISSLAALGVSFADNTGQLSFDQSTFDAATSGQTVALQQFLGSPTSGGFLQMATNTLTDIEDPTFGMLTEDISNTQSQITSTNTQISNESAQVSQLQTNLTQQMAAADAMIYSLQQQSTYFQQMFAAQNANNTAGLA